MDFTPPDFTDGPNDDIGFYQNTIVVPPPPEGKNQSIVISGALDASGETIPQSITWRGKSMVSRHPFTYDKAAVKEFAGTHLFAGVLFGHFGHFLVESTCRLWACESLGAKIDSIIYTPKVQRNTAHIAGIYQKYLALLDIHIPITQAETPLLVENLYVPQQGFGMFQMVGGTASYRHFMRNRAGKSIKAEGPAKLYISRSNLPPQRGGILGEKRLEELLAAQGYQAFHPQSHSFAEQFARYKAATHIIALDGSPLHMAALVVDPTAKVAVIARRPGIAEAFRDQFKAFADIDATIHNYLTGNWVPEADNRASRVSFGEIDFAALGNQLAAASMIGDGAKWPALTISERAVMLRDIEEKQGSAFKLLAE